MDIRPIILCGGSGTRLWPLSREMFPKQLLSLFGDSSLLQNTVQRLSALNLQPPIFVSNEQHRFLVAEQLRQIGVEQFDLLLEPIGRNTAPALAVAALKALETEDSVLLVLPADHVITNEEAFHQAVEKAFDLAEQGCLVTFGIQPSSAETGYGYICRGEAIGDIGFQVSQFVEKPSLEVAERYLESGEYYWNSGMFLLKASRYVEELAVHEPEMLEACRKALLDSRKDMGFICLDKEAFTNSPANSIDYSVMEKVSSVAVVPLDAEWSDVGSFSSLWEIAEKDENRNVTQGDTVINDCEGCYVNASSGRLVALLGLQNIIVVETADAILVAERDAVQNIKNIVSMLKKDKRDEVISHRRVYRPWGYYEGIDYGQRYQVKRIGVKPGASLSLQMHFHRAEHWIVVSGTAEVMCEDKVFLVAENESTYIPLGHKHRLCNPGKTMLEMIEVQSGSYLGEDDIVRFTDNYGRA